MKITLSKKQWNDMGKTAKNEEDGGWNYDKRPQYPETSKEKKMQERDRIIGTLKFYADTVGFDKNDKAIIFDILKNQKGII